MLDYAEPVTKLIDEFKRLPSIGQKSAQRLAFYILRAPETDVERLIQALREVKERITECSICNNLTDINPCRFCSLPSRDRSLLCVVEQPYDDLVNPRARGRCSTRAYPVKEAAGMLWAYMGPQPAPELPICASTICCRA